MSVLRQLGATTDEFTDGWPDIPTVHDANRAYLATLFDHSDARRIVTDPAVRPIELGMVRQGAPTPTQPDADHPTETLVLNGLHLTWPPLNAAARQLAAELGHPVTANVYRTPPNSAGYGPHWDTHHVLLAQVEGEKAWRLHPPVVDDPLDRHRWTAVGFTPEQFDRVHQDAETITLSAGQVLYIPRGWVHFGATGAEHSLHITFGVQLLTRHWVLQHLLDQAAESAPLRAALPPALSEHPIEAIVDDARKQLAAFLADLDPAKAGDPISTQQQLAVLGVRR
ncbi:Cupin superfamily protein [Streptomyces sp. TLI_053]|uniref:JmjC domain-containing protein n=1 Tax=Streptomyces sp. TLI_053 TaxID=1855352 RepID=UPI00087A6414|nr:cupin domain-containing protein [Streptomyces sp. TLI_053]SDT69915.1 Cupin superfamily protein [Streptomyces sp. TLI_053]